MDNPFKRLGLILKLRSQLGKKRSLGKRLRILLGNLLEIPGYLSFGLLSYFRTRPLPPPEKVKKILVIRLDHLGDLLMTTPFLQALRHKFPGAEITVLISPAGRELIQAGELCDQLFFYRPFWYAPNSFKDFSLRETFALIKKLRAAEFDLVFNARPGDGFSAFLAYLSSSPHRIGSGLNFGTFWLNHYISPGDWESEHWVEATLRLLRETYGDFPAFALKLKLSPEDKIYVETLLREAGILPGSFILIHPGVRDPMRDWEIAKFAQLADALTESLGYPVVLVGGEQSKIKAIRDGSLKNPKVIKEELTLPQLAELIRESKMLIGLESLAGHLAAAVGTPAVIIYGGITPGRRFSPYTENKLVIKKEVSCAPCFSGCRERKCLTEITVDDVIKGITEWGKVK